MGQLEQQLQQMIASFSYLQLYQFASKFDLLLIFLGTLGAVTHGVSYLLIILQFGSINNSYGNSVHSADRAFHEISKTLLRIVCIGAGIIFSSAIETVCWMLAGENVTSGIKTRYLQSLLSQEVGFYDTNVRTGDTVTAISSDILLIHDAVGEKVGAFINNLSCFISGITIPLIVFWKMGLLGMVATPLLLITGGFYMMFYTKYSAQASAAGQKADLVTEQIISHVRTVYSFVGEVKMLAVISKLLQEATKLASKTGLSKGIGIGSTFAVIYSSWGLQLWYAGIAIEQGAIKAGTAYALILISLFGGRALGDTFLLIDPVVKGKAAAVRLFEVIHRKTLIDKNDGEVPETLECSIEFCDVTFAYPSRAEVLALTDLSFQIPEGKIVALVGPSGSGKSSIVSLIQRFYDPQSGAVKIGGIDIRKFQLNWLRKQMGLVSQEPVLFATTIKDNILMGKPEATYEEMVEASKMANSHGFISVLPDGYETQVGEKGIQMSGGQKQRIAIARAILRKPGILLLDEATSALDSESETVVQKALDSIMPGRTTIVIAHRLSTIRNADEIVVLNNGAVAEKGTHDSLASREEGVYASLLETQNSIQSPNSIQSGIKEPYLDGKLEPLIATAESTTVITETKSRVTTHISFTSWFFQRVKETWPLITLGSLGACISGVVTAVFPLLMINIIILFLKDEPKDANRCILSIVGLGVINLFGALLQFYFGHKSGARIAQKFQELSLKAVMNNEVGWFDFEDNGGAKITARISSNSAMIRTLMSDTYNYFLQNFVAIILAVVLAFLAHWQMALVTIAVIPVHVAGTAITDHFHKQGLAGNVRGTHEKAVQLAGEAAANVRTVYSFGVEQSIMTLFKQQLSETKSRRFRRSVFLGVCHGLLHSMTITSSGFLLWYGGDLMRKGKATFEPVLRAITVVTYTVVNCMALLKVFPDFVKGRLAINSMFQLSTRKSHIDLESPAVKTLKHVNGRIEFEQVTIFYPARPQVQVLSKFSLTIEAGSTVALVGLSGSGKSTVLSLIQRFYDPTSGRVLLDGIDIKSLNLRWMRRHIGFVQQEPALFAVSIKQNILFGNESASEVEMIEAAKLANAHDFISSLPNGYETEAGERGVQLSGGQKQRIAIARAIIKKPGILLLDEATSALDAESERVVQQAIENLVQEKRTTVIVAHRLSTIQYAEAIVVMENGSIVEKGAHTELLTKSGPYARLVNSTAPGGCP